MSQDKREFCLAQPSFSLPLSHILYSHTHTHCLSTAGVVEYQSRVEGALFDTLHNLVDPAIDRSRTDFEVGDACNLRSDLGPFDAVLLANLICRFVLSPLTHLHFSFAHSSLPDPMRCLVRMASLVRPGGVLLITTPFSWMDTFTSRDKWLGARVIDGEPVRSLDALKAVLSPDFELLEETPVEPLAASYSIT